MAFDAFYNALVYMQQGGSRQVVGPAGVIEITSTGAIDVETGGAITVKSGGSLDIESGGSITVASGAAIGTSEAADANVVGVAEVVHRIAIADAAADTDVTLTNKTLITNVYAIKTAGNGGAGDTVTVKNAANAITNAIDLNVVDKTHVGVTTIDDAYSTIAAAGTLKVTAAKATNVTCMVVVEGVRVA